MDTLEELKYYCDEPQPVGALMLTGEWGCGKTYLLNNSLSNVLKDKCVFLRVSLFGMSSIEEVKKEVKQCWIRTVAELNTPASGWVEKAQKYTGVFKTVADKGAEHLPEPWKSIVSGALSFNVIDFVKVEPKMGDKKVILIFDDLERTDIPTADLLGCINDYCENLHINTIVVANEEKIQSSEKDKIKYSEIKEKIIQRTIHYVPDYSSVVSNVIDSIECKDDDAVSQEYKALLTKYKEIISSIFSGASVEGIPLEQLISKKYSGNSREELESEKNKIQDLNIDRITSEALNVQFKILKEYIYYLMKSILIIEKNGFLHIFHMYCVSGRDWFKKVSDMEHFFLMKRCLYFTLDFMMINILQVELSNGLGMESGRKILLMQNLIMS